MTRRASARSPATDSLSTYLDEIARHPLLTAQEELDLARALAEARRAERLLTRAASASPARRRALQDLIKTGERARTRLIESNLRLVVTVARRYQGHGLSLLDLIQEGNVGLQRGIDHFDWRRGYRLSTYVFWWIRQAITRALANQSRLIRLPVHAGQLAADAARVEERLGWVLERQPSLAEIAAVLQVEPERLSAIRLAAATPASLEAPVHPGADLTQADLLPDDTALTEVEATSGADELSARVAAAVATLPAREREVLRWRFGLGQPYPRSLAEIGALLGVTRERARQIESRALRMLRSNRDLRRAAAARLADE